MMATLMGSYWYSYKHQLSRDFEILAETLHEIFEYSAKLSIIPVKLAMNLRLPVWKKFVASADTAFEIVRMLVPEMAKLGGNGLLKKMMDEGIRAEDAICIVTDFILAAGDTVRSECNYFMKQKFIFEIYKNNYLYLKQIIIYIINILYILFKFKINKIENLIKLN